MNSDNLIEFL